MKTEQRCILAPHELHAARAGDLKGLVRPLLTQPPGPLQDIGLDSENMRLWKAYLPDGSTWRSPCYVGEIGDFLAIEEPWFPTTNASGEPCLGYTGSRDTVRPEDPFDLEKYHHHTELRIRTSFVGDLPLPAWAIRFRYRITDMRIARYDALTEDEVLATGVHLLSAHPPKHTLPGCLMAPRHALHARIEEFSPDFTFTSWCWFVALR